MPQSAPVLLDQAAGVPGEIYDSSPSRVLPYALSPANTQPNIIGATAYTQDASTGFALVGQSGTNVYLGILITPKEHASFGTSGGGPFAPTLTLPNGVTAAFMTMGRVFVTLGASANVGDYVIFDNITGTLTSVAPGVDLPGGKSWANASVLWYDRTGSGLAVIEMTTAAPITDTDPSLVASTAKKGAK